MGYVARYLSKSYGTWLDTEIVDVDDQGQVTGSVFKLGGTENRSILAVNALAVNRPPGGMYSVGRFIYRSPTSDLQSYCIVKMCLTYSI